MVVQGDEESALPVDDIVKALEKTIEALSKTCRDLKALNRVAKKPRTDPPSEITPEEDLRNESDQEPPEPIYPPIFRFPTNKRKRMRRSNLPKDVYTLDKTCDMNMGLLYYMHGFIPDYDIDDVYTGKLPDRPRILRTNCRIQGQLYFLKNAGLFDPQYDIDDVEDIRFARKAKEEAKYAAEVRKAQEEMQKAKELQEAATGGEL